MTELTQDRVLEIYEDFARGCLHLLRDKLDEEIDFLSHAPADIFPYLGKCRGREEVIRALSMVHERLEVITFWPITVLIDGNNAALTVVISVKERSSGRSAYFLAAHFLRFRHGRIAEYRAIIDSLDAVRQLANS